MLPEEMQKLAQRPVVLYVNVFPFRIDAGEIRYLILQRRDDVVLPSVWQPVSGKISAHGSIRPSFTDQVQKKTGLTPSQIVPIDHLISYYDHHYDCVMMVPCAGVLTLAGEIVLDDGLHTQGR